MTVTDSLSAQILTHLRNCLIRLFKWCDQTHHFDETQTQTLPSYRPAVESQAHCSPPPPKEAHAHAVLVRMLRLLGSSSSRVTLMYSRVLDTIGFVRLLQDIAKRRGCETKRRAKAQQPSAVAVAAKSSSAGACVSMMQAFSTVAGVKRFLRNPACISQA